MVNMYMYSNDLGETVMHANACMSSESNVRQNVVSVVLLYGTEKPRGHWQSLVDACRIMGL